MNGCGSAGRSKIGPVCATPTPNAVAKVPFAQRPAVVAAGHAEIHFLDVVLADVADEHAPVGVPGELLGMAQAVGPDFRRSPRSRDEWIVGGNAVAALFIGFFAALFTRQGIDAQDGTKRRRQILAVPLRVEAAAAVAEADVEQAVVRRSGLRRGVEGEGADVVRRLELADAQHFPRGAAKHIGGRVGGGKLAHHALLRFVVLVGGAALVQIVGHAAVRPGTETDVEFAVAKLARGGELRMKGEAEQPGLVRKQVVVEVQVLAAQIQVHGRRTLPAASVT